VFATDDSTVRCRYYLALTHWLLGSPDRARDALGDVRRVVDERRPPAHDGQRALVRGMGTFTEALSAADLREARRLLEAPA